MSAISKHQANKQPPFPLKPIQEESDYPTKRLVHRIVANGFTDVRKVDTPFCPDPSDKERLVSVLDDYKDNCASDELDYSDAQMHKKVVGVLGKDLRRSWEKHLQTVAEADQTTDRFVEHCRSFLRTYLSRSAFQVQKEYMLRATKPYHLDCYEAASRLRTINDLSVYLPGSGGGKLYPNDTELKNAYYHLMLPKWQTNFDAAGHSTDDPNYDIDRMTTFMEQQRLISELHKPKKNNSKGNNRSNNRFKPYNTQRGGSGSSYRGNNQGNGGRGNGGQFRTQGTQNSPNTRNRGNQTTGGRGHFRPNQRPQTRSQGYAAPQHSNQNRDTRGLQYFGEPEEQHAQNGNDNYQQDNYQQNYQQHDNYYEENQQVQDDYGPDNQDGFHGDNYNDYDNNHGNQDQAGSQGDAFFAGNDSNDDPWTTYDANYSAYDTYDY